MWLQAQTAKHRLHRPSCSQSSSCERRSSSLVSSLKYIYYIIFYYIIFYHFRLDILIAPHVCDDTHMRGGNKFPPPCSNKRRRYSGALYYRASGPCVFGGWRKMGAHFSGQGWPPLRRRFWFVVNAAKKENLERALATRGQRCGAASCLKRPLGRDERRCILEYVLSASRCMG